MEQTRLLNILEASSVEIATDVKEEVWRAWVKVWGIQRLGERSVSAGTNTDGAPPVCWATRNQREGFPRPLTWSRQ